LSICSRNKKHNVDAQQQRRSEIYAQRRHPQLNFFHPRHLQNDNLVGFHEAMVGENDAGEQGQRGGYHKQLRQKQRRYDNKIFYAETVFGYELQIVYRSGYPNDGGGNEQRQKKTPQNID
jgi:hypothetical protein